MQYYNGVTRPAMDGLDGIGSGSVSALAHYRNLVDDVFGGDATKIVFGFCISGCGGTGSNANHNQAVAVLTDLAEQYACNGGAFFWVAQDDVGGSWGAMVDGVLQPRRGCSADTFREVPVGPMLASSSKSYNKTIVNTEEQEFFVWREIFGAGV